MLYEAFNWRTGSGTLPPEAEKYVDGWGRPGDLGVIADDDLGAAWIRRFTKEDHGYGFVAPDVPELSIGVAKDARGRGVGTALLEELLTQTGDSSISLSVETDNPAVRLYERFGFVRVGYVGTAWTMLRILG